MGISTLEALLHISLLVPCRYHRYMTTPRSGFRYRIRNWRQYNRALINRGRLTVWFDEKAVVAWHNTEPAAGPGAPRL